MRKAIAFLSLTAAAVALAGCGSEEKKIVVEKPASSAAPATTPAAPSASTPAAKPAAGAYPLDTCVVSGEKLGSMGDPVVYDHEGTEVRFCCPSCVKEFKKDPKKYLAALEAAKGKR